MRKRSARHYSRQIHRDSRLEIIRGGEQGEMGGYCLMVTEFLFGVMKVLEIHSGDGCTTL